LERELDAIERWLGAAGNSEFGGCPPNTLARFHREPTQALNPNLQEERRPK
jgi:hypothetical protein